MNLLIVSETTKNNYEYVENKLKKHNVEFADKTNYIDKIKNHEYVIAGRESYTKEIIETSEKLKVISRCGHGTDAIDKKIAKKLDIKVLDARGALDDTMADITIGYMIAALRKFVEIDKKTRQEGWCPILGNDLTEKTIGIIGLGGIGTAVAKRLQGFRTNTIFHDIDEEKQKNYPFAKFMEKEDVFEKSDIITLHCDLNELSKNIINKKSISEMKKGVIIINTARGPMVNLEDLKEGVENEIISYSVLDVFPEEPLPINHDIRKTPNILLGSHSTCYSQEGQRKLAEKAVNNLLREIQ